MNIQQFNKLCEELEHQCVEVLGERCQAYSEDNDRLSLFKDMAQLTGLRAEQMCTVLVAKHIIALNKAVREGYNSLPLLLEYTIDIINYHKLLWGILNEAHGCAEAKKLGRVFFEPRPSDRNEFEMLEPADRSTLSERTPGCYHGVQRAAKRPAPLRESEDVGQELPPIPSRKEHHPQW